MTILSLLCITLLPLFNTMLGNLQERKKEMVASRLLYEHSDHFLHTQLDPVSYRNHKGILYQLVMEEQDHHLWRACVRYEEKQICIES